MLLNCNCWLLLLAVIWCCWCLCRCRRCCYWLLCLFVGLLARLCVCVFARTFVCLVFVVGAADGVVAVLLCFTVPAVSEFCCLLIGVCCVVCVWCLLVVV